MMVYGVVGVFFLVVHLEGCHLGDADLAAVPFAIRTVKCLCFRSNDLVRPWKMLMEKFPELIFLDCRKNSEIKFKPKTRISIARAL